MQKIKNGKTIREKYPREIPQKCSEIGDKMMKIDYKSGEKYNLRGDAKGEEGQGDCYRRETYKGGRVTALPISLFTAIN